jgi:crotonobetainyl-CoA:carnitine CoA-transferase CaiB-like acyl-CoA transferase
MKNKKELNSYLERFFLTKTTQEWVKQLEAKAVLCTEVRSFSEAVKDPQTKANKMLVDVDHPGTGSLQLLGTPVRLHGTKPVSPTHAPGLGENTKDILSEIGYSTSEIESLVQEGIFG